mgnify:FL=1
MAVAASVNVGRDRAVYGVAAYQRVHGGNVTVVLNRTDPNPRIWPFFEEVDPPDRRKPGLSPTNGDLVVLEMTSDGMSVIYQTREILKSNKRTFPTVNDYTIIRSATDPKDFGRRVASPVTADRAALSPDDRQLATVLPGKQIAVVDLATGRAQFIMIDW